MLYARPRVRFRATLTPLLALGLMACSHTPTKKPEPTRRQRSAALPSRKPAPPQPHQKPVAKPKAMCVAGLDVCPQRSARSAIRADYEARAKSQRAPLQRLQALIEDPGIPNPRAQTRLETQLDASQDRPAKHEVELSVRLNQGAWTSYARADAIRQAIQALGKVAFIERGAVSVPVRAVCVEDRAGNLSGEFEVAETALQGLQWRSPGPFVLALVLEGDGHELIKEAKKPVEHGFDALTSPGHCAVTLVLPAEGSLDLKRRFKLDDAQLCAVRAGTVRFLTDPEDRRQRYAIAPRGGAR